VKVGVKVGVRVGVKTGHGCKVQQQSVPSDSQHGDLEVSAIATKNDGQTRSDAS
jgi:hypothetical protein